MYEVNGWFKFAEVDDHENGCDPDTAFSFGGEDRFSGLTIDEVLIKLRAFVGVDDDYEIELDAADECGRVDISVLETAEAYPATPREIEMWRDGNLRLWAACYSFRVEEVIRKQVRLKEV